MAFKVMDVRISEVGRKPSTKLYRNARLAHNDIPELAVAQINGRIERQSNV